MESQIVVEYWYLLFSLSALIGSSQTNLSIHMTTSVRDYTIISRFWSSEQFTMINSQPGMTFFKPNYPKYTLMILPTLEQ